jgi:hypothetical protein
MTSFDLKPFQDFLDARDRVLDGQGLGRNVGAFLGDLNAALNDSEGLAKYADACPVAGATPIDYAPRLVELGSSCTVIARIHFRGLDLKFPFVDISAQTAPLPDCLDPLFETFAVFQPKAVRCWRSPWEPPLESGHQDLAVFAGHIPSLLATPAASTTDPVTLVPDPSLDSFDDYLLTYETLHRVEPGLVGMAAPEDRASLLSCFDGGGYFRVLVDGRQAGFVAARLDSFRLWSGWCVIEQVLKPAFRGRDLAPSLQRALFSRLDVRRAPSVFGTINARNTPSSRTALRVGRQLVEIATFLPREGAR